MYVCMYVCMTYVYRESENIQSVLVCASANGLNEKVAN